MLNQRPPHVAHPDPNAEQRLGVNESRPNEWWYSDLLEYTHDAIIVWAMGGKGIVYWNRAAEQLYGYARDEVYGKITHSLLKTRLPAGTAQLEESIRRYGIWVGELLHTASDGHNLRVKTRLVLLPSRNGEQLVVEINREIPRPR